MDGVFRSDIDARDGGAKTSRVEAEAPQNPSTSAQVEMAILWTH